jgi:hypothetical protein
LVAALVISVTSSVGAQTTTASDATPPVSLRAGRGHTTVLAGVAITATSTSDGLVEVVAVRDTARLQLRSREPLVTRGVFRPAIIDRWLAALDSIRSAVAGDLPFDRLQRSGATLQDGDAMRLQANAIENSTKQRHFGLAVVSCRGPRFQAGTAELKQLPALVTILRAAADDARRAPNADIDPLGDGRTFYEHGVACPAVPLASNPSPVYPQPVPPGARRREVVTRFVVDTTGLVIPGSVRVSDFADPQFAAAARSTLSRWRFTKATRRGVVVRQLSHASLVFEPPSGDVAEPGCAMFGRFGVLVRPVSSSAGSTLEPEYLTHVATGFGIWFERSGGTDAVVRFVVHRAGTVTDAILDRPPSDSARRAEWEMKLRNIPFVLDPLPPTYPAEAVALQATFVERCRSPRRALFWGQPTTVTPLGDGFIELANLHPGWALVNDTREEPSSRDAVTPAALRRFLDTTAKLLPSGNGTFPKALDRWSGSLAEVPILGYRGKVGLELGLGTQGQLHGGIHCGELSNPISVRREDLAGFWRIGREALARRRAGVIPRQPRTRAYYESEVACPALPMVGNAAIRYPSSMLDDDHLDQELLFELTVDTLGRVVASSVSPFPGTPPDFGRAIREAVRTWRFRPALRAGRRVRQQLHMALVVSPPDAKGALQPNSSVTPADTTSRTIFFKKKP